MGQVDIIGIASDPTPEQLLECWINTGLDRFEEELNEWYPSWLLEDMEE